MITIQKLRSLINIKLKEIAPSDLIKYSLRTVAKREYNERNTFDIEYLEIDGSIRNKGLGKDILNVMIETMFENSIDCIVITASDLYGTDFNKLVCLYKSLGFKEIEGGVVGCMYMTNNSSLDNIQQVAELDIIESSRLQQVAIEH